MAKQCPNRQKIKKTDEKYRLVKGEFFCKMKGMTVSFSGGKCLASCEMKV